MNQRKIWIVKGQTYGDFDIGFKEPLMAASTKEKANQVKRILEKFIQNECTEEAKSRGYCNDLDSYDLMFGFFLRNDEQMRSKLALSLSCAMMKHEAQEFIDALINKSICVYSNAFEIEEMFFYC